MGHAEQRRERAERQPDEHQLRQRGIHERQGSRLLVVFQEPLQAEARPLLAVRDPPEQAVGHALLVAAVDAVR